MSAPPTHKLNLPWQVVRNWHGKIAIVDARYNGKDTSTGRVCNLPQGKDERGVFIAELICLTMNERFAQWDKEDRT